MKKVLVIGGGLAGLIAAIRLGRAGIPCLLVERRAYPFHRVCGEYISNEALSFLQRESLLPPQISLPNINRFELTSVSGRSEILPLDLGGFGISRYTFDAYLATRAREDGVEVIQKQEVDSIHFISSTDNFEIHVDGQPVIADYVIGAHGKRSKIDYSLSRHFVSRRSPFVGVKYHVKANHPADLIALHNFNGGYCGISNIEEGKTNLCYLVHRDVVRTHQTIRNLEEKVLCSNPRLRSVWEQSTFLFEKPETINEISFVTKEPVYNHLLMAGDAAGMIAPLCGNGMGMAIHSGKIVSDLVIQAIQDKKSRTWLEQAYKTAWMKSFSNRLKVGRLIQNYLFGSAWSSRMAVGIALHAKPVARFIIRNTHGKPF